ncbi:MAG: NAD(P)H-hydrate dehydratase [Chloroflexi bacterium]|nr:NAD(P)H-hydrate dehydratase [Chloroflexota bacterium]
MKLVTASQMQAIEQSCIDAGVSLDKLMENAGLAVAEAVRAEYGEHSQLFGKRIAILVGSGNNGADGFVAGRHLAEWGAKVTAVLCAARKSSDPKRDAAICAGVTVMDGLSDSGLDSLRQILGTADALIDAILGTGLTRPITEPLSSLVFAVMESAVPIFALDLPTGLNSDTGEFDIAGLPADHTLMLGYPKLGPAISGDPTVTGEISVLNIGIPQGLDSQVTSKLITENMAAALMPERPFTGHKGTFGSTLIVGGSKDYLGAVTMATDAATRSGVGLTFVATSERAYRQIAGNVPEAMYRSLPTDENGILTPTEAARSVLEMSQKSSTLVIGPGLGHDPSTREFLSIVLSQVDPAIPLVLDADALNILSSSHFWWERLDNPTVLTPHPGEMGRLMGITTSEVLRNRVAVVRGAAEKFRATVVLKGSATLIAAPDGQLTVSPWVNTGLAKGGSGDVLAGLLGGLLAQQPDEPFEMASLAVFIHGYAANAAKRELGETGMRATDVIQRLGLFYRDFNQYETHRACSKIEC